jgi:hypothetical protein
MDETLIAISNLIAKNISRYARTVKVISPLHIKEIFLRKDG